MSIIHSSVQNEGGGSSVDIGDNIPYSCMLDSSLSQYFSRTFGTSTAANTSTTSVWAKKCETVGATGKMLFQAGGVATNSGIWHQGGTSDNVVISNSAGSNLCASTAALRDPLGWDHYCVVNNAGTWTFYKTNVSIATGSGTCNINQAATAHYIGSGAGTSYFANMYLANFNFVDGQALTPSSFGRVSADTGQWVNKTYTGTYGNNGFKLEFNDPTFATYGMGKDTSGNNNHWTPAGGISSANQYTDTPTNNSCTLNQIGNNAGVSAGSFDIRSGNNTLYVANNSSYRNVEATWTPEGRKGYFEITHSGAPNGYWGVQYQSIAPTNTSNLTTGTFDIDYAGTAKNGTATLAACTSTFATGDVINVAFDFTGTNRNLWFGRNGVWGSNGSGTGDPITGAYPVATNAIITQACRFYFAINTGGGAYSTIYNFGAKTFAYPAVASAVAAAGFKALNTANLPEGTAAAPATFTGNANADGTYIPMNGTPETLSINGNAVTWGTHADRTAGGVKLRTASASYNASGSNTISASTFLTPNRKSVQKYQTAKGNP